MVKIEIKIEGENIESIIKELSTLLETNKKQIRDILDTLAVEALDVLEEKKIVDRGAELYIKLNRAINWKYKEKR
jgi:hypothetical protein